MSEIIEYIDAYFNQELNESERKEFEARCTTDENFASDVAFYISARGVAREALLKQKQQWKNDSESVQETVAVKPAKKPLVLRWIPYAAAACLVFIMALSYLFLSNNPRRLANNFINENYAHLYHVMDASRDSMQLGISEYNNKNYQRAALLFNGVEEKDPSNSDAKKYTGLAYFQLGNYDKALQYFKELADMKGLYSNSGDFLQAITLLQRNATGDKEAAKALLQKVVNENEDGSDVAKKMLEKW